MSSEICDLLSDHLSLPALVPGKVLIDQVTLAHGLKVMALRCADYSDKYDDRDEPWFTYQGESRTYTFVGSDDRPLSGDPNVALLVDAMNFLLHGTVMHLEQDDAEERLEIFNASM